jgi:hypothetical protein
VSFCDLTLILKVPALLRCWKRLQSGLELSAEAFLNLSKCFKEQSKTWLAEDNIAQHTRHNSPDAMDIYDTLKSQGTVYINYIPYEYMIIISSSYTFHNIARAYFGGI